jgi:glutamine phosphoribosylpyrophosphate amidotransferase
MCGLFGYAGDDVADLDRVIALGRIAERRGMHACGMTGLVDGKLVTVRFPKAFSRVPKKAWLPLKGAARLIGHCRLATVGALCEKNAQPFATSDVAIAHNGNAYGYQRVAAERGLTLETTCDSEVLLRLIEADRSIGPLAALKIADAGLSALLVLSRTGVVRIASTGMPLFRDADGYLCSIPSADGATRRVTGEETIEWGNP